MQANINFSKHPFTAYNTIQCVNWCKLSHNTNCTMVTGSSNPSSFNLMTEAYLSSSNILLQCVSVCIETPGPLSCQVSITLLVTRVGNWIFFLQR